MAQEWVTIRTGVTGIMARTPRQVGDKVVIGAVDGTTGLKKYDLVPAQNNYSYSEVSDQREAQIGQELVWPLSFHGGVAYSTYNPRQAGVFNYSSGNPLGHIQNEIVAPAAVNRVTLTGAANPPNYFFETNVGSTSSGKPVLYIIANEAAEINVYKISLDSADFGTLLVTKTFSVTPTQPCGQPAEWNNGTDTRWYLGLGDSTNRIQRLATVATGSNADTWTASSDADARQLKVVGNRLMRSTNENQVSLLPRAGNPLTEASWGSDFFVGDVSANITELGEASGLGYIAKEDGFYEWDTVGQAVNVFPAIGRAERNGQGMVYWHGGFLIPTASGLWWTRTGAPVGPDSNPYNYGNQASVGAIGYLKQGRWNGLVPFGPYIFGVYVVSSGTTARVMWGRERDPDIDPPGWGPIVWHDINNEAADFDDHHGIFISELSEFGASDVRPSLWIGGGAAGEGVTHRFLDRDGGVISRRGDIDLDTSGTVTSGRFDFGLPNVNKQLGVIEAFVEDFGSVVGSFRWGVFRDGGSLENVGATITADGFVQRFWTQDSNDTARELNVRLTWIGSSSLTNTNGPRVKNPVVRAVALPDTAQIWTFNFWVADGMVKTAKKLRSELEAFKNDLKQYELPDGDKVNGAMTSIRLLRADEIRELFSDMQPPPKYVLQAQVREMVSA